MLNIITVVGLLASFNVALVSSKAFPIQLLQFEIDLNADELLNNEGSEIILKRSLDNLGNIMNRKRAFGPGSLDPLGNGNIPKWSKKSSYTRDYKRSLDYLETRKDFKFKNLCCDLASNYFVVNNRFFLDADALFVITTILWKNFA